MSDWDLEVSEDDEETTTSDLESSGSASATVYTRPGIFSDYDFAENAIIENDDGLTAEKVSDWCTHCGKFLSWKNQSDKYSDAENCKVSQGDWITATWYNTCAELCGCNTRVSNN